jgi:crotonobetainyl-CoA:carnitine CoA-transferase CaiB-like acyl-CoA transferase
MTGPLTDLRVVEIAGEISAFAGKLLADLGADVILVEPPGGSPVRRYPPFVDDKPDPGRSLWFWHYHTSKRGVTLDLEQPDGRALFHDLVAEADVVLESTPQDALEAHAIDHADLLPGHPRLIWAAVTPFGRRAPRAEEAATDLTLLAGGGPAWSSGYDDHSLPPVRGGGNQGYNTACHFAVMSILTALIHRDMTGHGQFIDVNAHAAQNVTTEAATYQWLVAGNTVQRQTGRHAAIMPSLPSQVQCADGRWVNSGFPPRRGVEYQRIYDWLSDLDALEEFPGSVFLSLGTQHERLDLARVQEDPELREIFTAGREAMTFIASRMGAYDFFIQGQERGFQVGIIYSPEEVLADPHFLDRQWPVEVEHEDLGRTVTYPGRPYRFEKTPWAISRRAPHLGEHNDEVFGSLGRSTQDVTALREAGVI